MKNLLTIPLNQELLAPLTTDLVSLRNHFAKVLEERGFNINACAVGFGILEFEFVSSDAECVNYEIAKIVKSFGFSEYVLSLF